MGNRRRLLAVVLWLRPPHGSQRARVGFYHIRVHCQVGTCRDDVRLSMESQAHSFSCRGTPTAGFCSQRAQSRQLSARSLTQREYWDRSRVRTVAGDDARIVALFQRDRANRIHCARTSSVFASESTPESARSKKLSPAASASTQSARHCSDPPMSMEGRAPLLRRKSERCPVKMTRIADRTQCRRPALRFSTHARRQGASPSR